MPETNQQSVLLAVSAPPFWHCGRTVQKTSLAMLIALSPAAIMAVLHWGIPAARVMALALFTGIIVEALCQKMMGREISVDDLSGVVSCLLFSFLLPANAPWWLVMIGATLAISLGKMAFGGLGANPVNTALVGWAMLSVSWPALMDPNAMQLDTLWIDPLVRLKYFGAEAVAHTDIVDLVLGKQIGGLGAAQVGALFVGGSWLAARGVIRWEIALSFFVGVTLVAAVYNVIDPVTYASPLFHLCTGSTLLGGFFLATEAASSPGRQISMMLYGCIGGALVIVIRVYGIYPDGVPFAILLINLLAPLLDSIHPKPFGAR
ncbi:MAG: RnfABCDGE type electron transport complex subunit D [Bilophila sp.]